MESVASWFVLMVAGVYGVIKFIDKAIEELEMNKKLSEMYWEYEEKERNKGDELPF